MPASSLRHRAAASAVGLAAALALALVACRNPAEPEEGTVCTLELRAELSPRDTTLVVGASFTPSVALSSCGGRKRLTDSVTWAAADGAVVSVDPATGRTTARGVGETRVEATGARYGRVGGIAVTVRAAP